VIIQAVGGGAGRAFRKPGLIAILWLTNVLFSLTIVAPFALILWQDFGHSVLGEKLGTVDFIWLGELLNRYRLTLPAAAGWLVASAVLYLLFGVFLNGGTVGRILDEAGRTSARTFFADCGRYFGRFFRLFLVSLVLDVLVIGGTLALLGALARPLTDQARTEWTVLVLSDLPVIVAVLLVTLVQLFFDYARILVVRRDEPRVLDALALAGRFLARRLFRAWFLYLLVAALFVAGTVVFLAGAGFVPRSGEVWIVAGLLWGQVYVAFRLWIKVVLFSAQAEYFRMNSY